jgi:hypothetical protein
METLTADKLPKLKEELQPFKLAARCRNCPKRLAIECYGFRKYQRTVCSN